MLFSSAIFLFLFLPLVLLVFYAAPKQYKNIVLLIFSLIFYGWGEHKFIVVMLATIFLNFVCGIYIEKGYRKSGLFVAVSVCLASLGFFKYFNFAAENVHHLALWLGIDSPIFAQIPAIALPMGISFYTFHTLSYVTDVYHQKIKANRSFIDFATYVTMFPQLVAGPIVRYIDIQEQLHNKKLNVENFALGLERFIVGLAKKMLIANSCAAIADSTFDVAVINDLSSAHAWIGIIAYSFQIYFDFSGYSDMAIGLGKMFGFEFLENFNYPYISKSIKEFWRRWHISLSSFFRDYVYVPLGGNRVKVSRTYVNLLIVFFVTGLWHGASWNFIVWGLFHGLFITIERMGFDKFLEKTPKFLQHFYTLFVVVIAWVFFRANDLTHAMQYLGKMFAFSSGDISLKSYITFYHWNMESLVAITAAVLFSAPMYARFDVILQKISPFAKMTVVFLLFLASVAFIAADTYNPFIYFRF